MNRKPYLYLFFAFCVFALSSQADAALSVRELRCEYQSNPLAVEDANPRLSWILESPQRNQRQTAYQILVSSGEEQLKKDVGDCWDTGKVQSGDSIQIAYAGKKLTSFTRYYWKARVWDRDGQPSPWSEIACWAMGLLQDSDWDARWLSFTDSKTAPPLFRRDFKAEKPVKDARVYLCGLGFYELRLNGEKVGDSLFDPGWTNYRKTCFYAAYDVTNQIRTGANAMGVLLGNGFFNVTGGRYVKYTGSMGDPKFILKLRIEYTDGSVAETVSDESWRVAPGPITFTCIYGGEDYDARLEQAGWDAPGFDDSKWQSAKVCEGPGGKLTAQTALPIRAIQALAPKKTSEPKPGVTVYDLGQNFSGIPSIEVKGAKGSTVKITPAELITDDGLANQKASGGPHYYTYTLKGEGVETWRPRFTYYGFRYLQVETTPADNPPELVKIEGLFTRYSATRVGMFECSSDLYNRIYRHIDWAVGSNLQSVLTDCPHREKLGWQEVAHLMAPSILFNYDVALFYDKVLRDIRDAQLENGLMPDIAPEYVAFSGGFRDSPEWGSSGVILPWMLYEWFGDQRALSENYDAMRRYVDYLTSTAKDGIVSHGLGDWYDYTRGGEVGESRLTPKTLTATAMYYRDAVLVSGAAKILGKAEDARRYAQLAESIRESFNRSLFKPDTNQYAEGSQTADSIPLVWDLVDPSRRAAVLQNLVKEVESRDYLTAGDVGFRFLLRALAENGRSDLVYRLTHRTDEPGYGYQIEQGATSLTEAWDGRKVVSHNHCMLGHLQEWFHHDLVGVQRDPAELAFKKVVIHPNPVGDITWAKGSYQSPYGKIACEWKRGEKQFTLNATIPVNTTATIFLPALSADGVAESGRPIAENQDIHFLRMQDGCAVYEVGSGDYEFTANIETSNVQKE